MSLSDDLMEAQRILVSLEPFYFGLDRKAYKKALRDASRWKNKTKGLLEKGGQTLERLIRKYDPEHLIFLDGEAFKEEQDRLLSILDQVGKRLNQPVKTKVKKKKELVGKVAVVQTPLPDVPDILENRYAISFRTLRAQFVRAVKNEESRGILRQSLMEAVLCCEVGAWKAASIMSGSTAEGLLTATLEQIDQNEAHKAYAQAFPQRKIKGPNSMSYEEALSACAQLDFFSEGMENFTKGVKNFRNLVHPDLELRAKEAITNHEAGLSIRSVLFLVHKLAHVFGT